MNGQQPIVGELEHHHLEQVAASVGANDQKLGRVAVGIEVDDHDRVVGGMAEVLVADAMTSSRSVDLHTPIA